MKNYSFINLFWAIVWGAVAILALVGYYWIWAEFVAAGVSAAMCGIFVKELLRYKRMK